MLLSILMRAFIDVSGKMESESLLHWRIPVLPALWCNEVITCGEDRTEL